MPYAAEGFRWGRLPCPTCDDDYDDDETLVVSRRPKEELLRSPLPPCSPPLQPWSTIKEMLEKFRTTPALFGPWATRGATGNTTASNIPITAIGDMDDDAHDRDEPRVSLP